MYIVNDLSLFCSVFFCFMFRSVEANFFILPLFTRNQTLYEIEYTTIQNNSFHHTAENLIDQLPTHFRQELDPSSYDSVHV